MANEIVLVLPDAVPPQGYSTIDVESTSGASGAEDVVGEDVVGEAAANQHTATSGTEGATSGPAQTETGTTGQANVEAG